MLVRLTGGQILGFLSCVPERLEPVFRHEVKVFDLKRDITAPYCAWQAIVAEASARAFTKGRRHDTDNVARLRHILGRVTTVSNSILMHPALRGVAMVGQSTDVIPAWRLPTSDEFGRIYSPEPVEGCRFEVLKPQWITVDGIKLTEWSRFGVSRPNDWLHDEALHWAIVNGTDLPPLRPTPFASDSLR